MLTFAKTLLRPLRPAVDEWRLRCSIGVRRLTHRRAARTLVVFPSNQPWDPSSNLRAWLVAPPLRELGWDVVVVPATLDLRRRRGVLERVKPDVVLLQQTRNPLNDPRLYPHWRCVLDVDDADFLDPLHEERIAGCVSHATAVIAGSRFVAQGLGRRNPRTHVLWTCTPRPRSAPGSPPQRRRPIVAWAHSAPLEYPLEARLVRDVMTKVAGRTRCEFWLYGTTPGQAEAWFEPIRAAGGVCASVPPLPYPRYLASLQNVAVGLQPVVRANPFSRGKSFGKLLGYLSAQVAVVASDAVDHALFFESWRNGVLVGDESDAWVDAIVKLLDDPELRSSLALEGWRDFERRLTTEVFAQRLDRILRDILSPAQDAEGTAPAGASRGEARGTRA